MTTNLQGTNLVFFAGKNHFGFDMGQDKIEKYIRVTNIPSNIVQIACANDFAYLLTASQQVYSIGKYNAHGELGYDSTACTTVLESEDRGKLSKHLYHLKSLDKCNIILLGCGRHSAYFSDGRRVYYCGKDILTSASVVSPKLLCEESALGGRRIVKITGGEYHVLVLTEDQCVFTMGKTGGNGTESDLFKLTLLTVGFNERVKDISSGHEHNLLLTTSGTCYGFGSGSSYGQLCGSSAKLNEIKFKERLKNVFCSSYHSFFLMENGDCYAAGYNSDNRLCINTSQYTFNEPTKIDFGKVKNVLGYVSTILINEQNEMYSVGANDGGDCGVDMQQLNGHSSSDVNVRRPTLITKPDEMVQFAKDSRYEMYHAAGVYFRFIYFKPKLTSGYQLKLWEKSGQAQLTDLYIETQH